MPGPRDRIGRPAPGYDAAADSPTRPDRGSAADLRLRLDRLPPGHPSAPADQAAPDARATPADRAAPERRAARPAPAERADSLPPDTPADRAAPVAGDRALAAGPPPSAESWQRDAPRLRARWEEIRARWARQDSPAPDRGADEPGGWRGDSGRTLSPEQSRQVDAYCDDLSGREQQITARLEALEQSSAGHLVGKEFRLKSPDRLKDKTAAAIEGAPGASPDRLLASIPDALRYTLQYDERDYSASAHSDIESLRASGFDLIKARNYWDGAEYKGLNTQWRDSRTGQRFELQFHTGISFEAKQITHHAYEYLRSARGTSGLEELSVFQRQVSDSIPVPPGARELPEFP